MGIRAGVRTITSISMSAGVCYWRGHDKAKEDDHANECAHEHKRDCGTVMSMSTTLNRSVVTNVNELMVGKLEILEMS